MGFEPEVFDEGDYLTESEDAKGQHVLASLHWLEANKGDLHGGQNMAYFQL